jgi:phosphatidylserine decarboxylase
MGSTIILLLAERAVAWTPRFVAGATVRMGEAIGECRSR